MRGWLILRTIKKFEAFRGFEDDLNTDMDVDCRHWTVKSDWPVHGWHLIN